MEHYVGLDVSLKLTAICIIDRTGKIEREGVVASDPEAIATFIKSSAPHVVRIGLETGATSTWLWTELNKMGLPVICIDARHAKAALKMQINKSDPNDAVGIARIMQCGWYKEVRVKDLDSHATKALLVSRALLVKIKRDIENQIRGLLKKFGLVIGRAKMNTFAARAAESAQDRPELAAAVDQLLDAGNQILPSVRWGAPCLCNRRQGPPLVKTANWLNHLEYDWESPIWHHLLEGLARNHTLVRYDARGNGLSDWDVDELSLDAWVSDLETVVDAIGIKRFPLLGVSQGCAVSIAYAVRHPELLSHLILYGGFALGGFKRSPAEQEK